MYPKLDEIYEYNLTFFYFNFFYCFLILFLTISVIVLDVLGRWDDPEFAFNLHSSPIYFVSIAQWADRHFAYALHTHNLLLQSSIITYTLTIVYYHNSISKIHGYHNR